MIKNFGGKAGVVLNPTTPLNVLDYIMDDISMVMVMAINPGIVGHKLIPNTFDKIRKLKEKLGTRNILIEVDGGVTFETAPIFIKAGVDILVRGSSTIFNQPDPISKQLRKFRAYITKELNS